MRKERSPLWFKKLAAFAVLFCCLAAFCTPCPLTAEKHKKKEKKYHVSATAIFCNEASFLREWIEYHQLIGIEHFYLYNNLSTDNFQEVLSPYVEKGVVEIIEWPKPAANWSEWDAIQVAAYRDAIKRSKHKTRWLAILDIDEFAVPVADNNLKTLLKKYENLGIGGICSMWSFFGTSHVEKIPQDKLMIESLILHTGPAANGDISSVWNQGAYKSIVRPSLVSGISSPHYCTYVEGFRHEMLPYDILHINHYWTRDNSFFTEVKIPRRKAWGQEVESAQAWAAGMNGWEENNAILRFVPELRIKMGLH